MGDLTGRPSDEVPAILAEGRSGISTIFVSMSARHPEGADLEYLHWHSLDHRPEQHRLSSVRASLRLVSTPQCRAARAAAEPPVDAVDHVMTYFFADVAGLEGFGRLSAALGDAGRKPYLLPVVERGVFAVEGRVAAARARVGADVLPWWPAVGVYLLLERGAASPAGLTAVDGVAGAWWASGVPIAVPGTNAGNHGLQITYCFLERDPVKVSASLRPVLDQRWADGSVTPLLAAPMWTLIPQDPARHLP